jgi:hypothetical protein
MSTSVSVSMLLKATSLEVLIPLLEHGLVLELELAVAAMAIREL